MSEDNLCRDRLQVRYGEHRRQHLDHMQTKAAVDCGLSDASAWPFGFFRAGRWLERDAYVCVRQSSPRQVVKHLESRRRQYARVD